MRQKVHSCTEIPMTFGQIPMICQIHWKSGDGSPSTPTIETQLPGAYDTVDQVTRPAPETPTKTADKSSPCWTVLALFMGSLIALSS